MGGFLKSLLVAGAAVMLVPAVAGSAIAKEVSLGTAVYEAKPQRDIIKVGAREGAFRAVRFEVKGSDVEVLDLKIVYGSGNAEDIRVRQVFRAGSSSRVIDLEGGRRAIKEIVITYMSKGPARIQFFGVEAAVAQPSWERLGCKDVGFVIDRDVVKVGRKEGTFRAIKLRVRKAPVEFFDLRVVYGSGAAESFRVRATVPPGSESRPIDLGGKGRGIDRVEMIYRATPSFKGTAEVCVDGLQK